jgi:hypothetical protein
MPHHSVWIAYAHWTKPRDSRQVALFESTWIVPPEPTTDSGQTLFLFNGMQTRPDEQANFDILQPVLEWRSPEVGAPPRWSVASWYATRDGRASLTGSTDVQRGTTLTGRISLVTARGDAFDYTSEFVGMPETRLEVHRVAELDYCVNTLEVIDVVSCSNFPASSETRFFDVRIEGDDGILAGNWVKEVKDNDCGVDVLIGEGPNQSATVSIRHPGAAGTSS